MIYETPTLKLKINTNKDEYYSMTDRVNNFKKINDKKTEIEEGTKYGAYIVPVNVINKLENNRVYHFKTGDEQLTTIAGKPVYVPDFNKTIRNEPLDTMVFYPNKVYSIYVIDDKAYIYWCYY